MPKVAISYRRSDSQAETGRIYDRLVQRFGRDQVFMDIDQIPIGVDFREHLAKALAEVAVLLVILGPRWAGEEGGLRRIDDPADWVRLEVETALKRGIAVVPVLLHDTPMPAVSTLPESLRDFAYRQSCRVEMGPDFNGQMDRLVRALAPSIGEPVLEEGPEADAVSPDDILPPRAIEAEWKTNTALVTTMGFAWFALVGLCAISLAAAFLAGNADRSAWLFGALPRGLDGFLVNGYCVAMVLALILSLFEQPSRGRRPDRPAEWWTIGWSPTDVVFHFGGPLPGLLYLAHLVVDGAARLGTFEVLAGALSILTTALQGAIWLNARRAERSLAAAPTEPLRLKAKPAAPVPTAPPVPIGRPASSTTKVVAAAAFQAFSFSRFVVAVVSFLMLSSIFSLLDPNSTRFFGYFGTLLPRSADICLGVIVAFAAFGAIAGYRFDSEPFGRETTALDPGGWFQRREDVPVYFLLCAVLTVPVVSAVVAGLRGEFLVRSDLGILSLAAMVFIPAWITLYAIHRAHRPETAAKAAERAEGAA